MKMQISFFFNKVQHLTIIWEMNTFMQYFHVYEQRKKKNIVHEQRKKKNIVQMTHVLRNLPL